LAKKKNKKTHKKKKKKKNESGKATERAHEFYQKAEQRDANKSFWTYNRENKQDTEKKH
jgi:hypothetical protein